MAMYGYVGLCRAMYGYVGLCMSVYGCVWVCMAMYGYVWLCRAMLGYVGLCKAIERNVFHILANGEPLYDAYNTNLPAHAQICIGFGRAKWTTVSLNSFTILIIISILSTLSFVACC